MPRARLSPDRGTAQIHRERWEPPGNIPVVPFRVSRFTLTCAALLFAIVPRPGRNDAARHARQPLPNPVPPLDIHVTVVGTTPLPGVEQPLDRVPAPVQTSPRATSSGAGRSTSPISPLAG